MTATEILDFTLQGQKRLRIVETGANRDTLAIAKWVRWNVASDFDSVSLNAEAQFRAHQDLEISSVARYCTFHTAFPKSWLANQSWIDVAFLNASGPTPLDEILEEFLICVSAGASTIILRNYSTEAAQAISSAKALGWSLEVQEPYLILRRPSTK